MTILMMAGKHDKQNTSCHDTITKIFMRHGKIAAIAAESDGGIFIARDPI